MNIVYLIAVAFRANGKYLKVPLLVGLPLRLKEIDNEMTTATLTKTANHRGKAIKWQVFVIWKRRNFRDEKKNKKKKRNEMHIIKCH